MDVNEDLVGSLVLLHPDVYFDAENQLGYTGVLTEVDVLSDRFNVDCDEGRGPRLFASDWLMVLKERNVIYSDLTDKMKELSKQDIKDLYGICLLLDSPEPEPYRRALELASANPVIRSATLVTLEEQLGPLMSIAQDRERSAQRGR